MKKHKADSRCSGIRNKTAFVSLSQFDEMALLNGEHFPVVLFLYGLLTVPSGDAFECLVTSYLFIRSRLQISGGYRTVC